MRTAVWQGMETLSLITSSVCYGGSVRSDGAADARGHCDGRVTKKMRCRGGTGRNDGRSILRIFLPARIARWHFE